jgi:predicted HTH domain antitoxin
MSQIMLNQINIQYQSSLLDAIQQSRVEFEQEAKLAMAVKLFEMKKLSSGMAAQLIGMDRVSFLLNLHHFGVAMINIEEDELLADIENA